MFYEVMMLTLMMMFTRTDRSSLVGKNIYLDSTSKLLPEGSGGEEMEDGAGILHPDDTITTTTTTTTNNKDDSAGVVAGVTTNIPGDDTAGCNVNIAATITTPAVKVDTVDAIDANVTDDPKRPSPEPRSEESDAGGDH